MENLLSTERQRAHLHLEKGITLLHYIIRSAAWILRAFLVSFLSSFRPICLQYIKISLASKRDYLSLLKADFLSTM